MDLIKSLKEYVNVLENSGTLEVYQPLVNEGKVTVTITADSYGQLTVKPAETTEKDVKMLETNLENAQIELKEANKTISKQEKEIANLTAQIKPTITQTTEEVAPAFPDLSSTPITTKRVRKART